MRTLTDQTRTLVDPMRAATQANDIYSVCWVRIGHVNFMLFVSYLFTLGTQRECGNWWNMGLTVLML